MYALFVVQRQDVTMEQLSRMVQRGFAENDVHFKGIDERLNGIDGRLDGVDYRLDVLEFEIREVKSILGPLARVVSLMEVDIHALYSRVNRLEKKNSIVK